MYTHLIQSHSTTAFRRQLDKIHFLSKGASILLILTFAVVSDEKKNEK